jgi:hypothetical protein
LWIVPAHVAGTHKTARGELTLTQDFQRVSGSLLGDGETIPVEGKVIGRQLVLAGGGRELRGRVNGSRVELS